MDTLVREDLSEETTAPRGGAAAHHATSAAPGELSGYVRALVQARGRIALFTAGATVATVLLAFLLPREWTAHAVLLPTDDEASALPSQLSGLASSMGLQFPFGPASQSDLYPSILTSERLLSGLLDKPFSEEEGAPPKPFLAILRPHDRDSHKTRMKAIRTLERNVVTAAKDEETGIVSLDVTTKNPHLSADVANALVGSLEAYLIALRQDEGRKNRTFIDGRLGDVSHELSAAEDRLTKFRQANRQIGSSPELQTEEARLQRDVMIQEQVFLELQKQKEIAEIEEVKNTPVIKVLDTAVPPIRPSRPMRVLMVAAALLLAAFASTTWVLLRAALRTSPDLADAVAPLAGDVRRLFRRRPRARLSPE
ncbi:MAG: GNVR domain-containing protein [bacterium]